MVKETTTTVVEYQDQIIYLRLKDGAAVNLENTIEQFAAQTELTKGDYYGVLVDGRNSVTMDKESRKYMSSYENPLRVATALLTTYNLGTRWLANFYLRIDKPKIETRMFGDEESAVAWLKTKLKQQIKVQGEEKIHTNTHK